jgi:hypothetical protein
VNFSISVSTTGAAYSFTGAIRKKNRRAEQEVHRDAGQQDDQPLPFGGVVKDRG